MKTSRLMLCTGVLAACPEIVQNAKMKCVVRTKNFVFALSLVLRKVTTGLCTVNVGSEIMAGV
jgi:hypothetical protein